MIEQEQQQQAVSIEDVQKAAKVIAPHAHVTPVSVRERPNSRPTSSQLLPPPRRRPACSLAMSTLVR